MRHGTRLAAILVIGAALLHGCASGPAGVRPEIRNEAGNQPSVTGTNRTVTITFQVRDEDLTRTSVRVESFVDGAWRDATLSAPSHGTLAGSAIDGLTLGDDWLACTVTWDTWADDVGKSGASPPPTTVRLTPSDIDGEGVAVEFQAAVDNFVAGLTVQEPSVTFEYGFESGVNPPDQSIHVQNYGPAGTTLDWSSTVSYVSGTAGWLTMTPASGSTTTGIDAIVLSVDPAGLVLAAGTYTATVELADPAAFDSPQSVDMTLTVSMAALTVDDSALTFTCDIALVSNPEPQTLHVTNTGGPATTLNWSTAISYDGAVTGWLSSSPTSGTTTTETDAIDISVAIAGTNQIAGTYTATLAITDPQASGSPAAVAVTLVVELPLGLVAYWRLDDGAGGVALDATGHGHDGTTSGGPAWVAGPVVGALRFDGMNDGMTVPHDPALNLVGDMTLSCWVQKTGEASNGCAFLSKGSVNKRTYELGEESGGKRMVFQQYDSGSWIARPWSTTQFEVGSWHHVACVVNGQSAFMYVDGVMEDSVSRSGIPPVTTDPLLIGNSWYVPFPGILDDIRIYNRALSASEIGDLVQ